jgi:hypothetical protein
MSLRSAAVLTAGVLTILTTSPLQAQDASRPDFTGTWVLSIDDSDFGMSPPPDSALIEIERADDHVVIARTSHHPAAGGENTTTLDMPADGETHEATTGDESTDASVEWDGEVLQLWIVAQSSVGAVDVFETWGIDENGARLTIDRLIEVPDMGEFEQTLVFTKRE